MKKPLAFLCTVSCAALLLALPAAAGNRPGWSDGPGCGDPGDGCAPGWTQKDGPGPGLRIRARFGDPAATDDQPRLRWRWRKTKDAGSEAAGYPGWNGPGGYPGWSGPGGYPGWTDPKVCTKIDDQEACNDHPVCRWHPAHEECVPE